MEQFRRDARQVKLRIGEHFIEDVTDVLKRFFRELEDPVFMAHLHPLWQEAASESAAPGGGASAARALTRVRVCVCVCTRALRDPPEESEAGALQRHPPEPAPAEQKHPGGPHQSPVPVSPPAGTAAPGLLAASQALTGHVI